MSILKNLLVVPLQFFSGTLCEALIFVGLYFYYKTMLLVLLCCLLGQGAFSYGHHINNASGHIAFSSSVSNGTSFSGAIVFLDSDIDFSGGFSEQFDPIGLNASFSFQGIFDGQGHTISILAINSSSQYVGLFGCTERATIKNVVMHFSCSVVSSYSGSDWANIGGIIGGCRADKDLV